MIEQLLDFARVRRGRGIGLHLVYVDLADVVYQVVQELGDVHPQARLEIAAVGDSSGRWDADRLGQVVSNLVGNAIQHGTAGQPVTIDLDGEQPAFVRLIVANAGVIAEDAIPTLFDPFTRGAPAKAGDRGLGLGLFIAHEIVLAHGGHLAVRVADGRTLFEATLPREAQAVETAVLAPP